MHVLILGCGYVGSAFGARLMVEGATVFGTCRSQDSARMLQDIGITPIIFDGTGDAALNEAAQSATIILASIPPNDAGDPGYLALRETLLVRCPPWIGYLSTTGVYGDRQGGWAFEDDPPTPQSPEAHRRMIAEAAWESLPTPAHVFRLPGIYGPGRSALDQVRSGTARRIDQEGQVFSRAHRDDIVNALALSIQCPNPGRIYNVCDDLPSPSGDVIAQACTLLGRPVPPLVPIDKANLSEAGQRFYRECKRVSNARLKAELGWRPMFPTFVEGLANCLANEPT